MDACTHLAHMLESSDVVHFDDAVLREAKRVLVVSVALHLVHDLVGDLRETRDALSREIEAVHVNVLRLEAHLVMPVYPFLPLQGASPTKCDS